MRLVVTVEVADVDAKGSIFFFPVAEVHLTEADRQAVARGVAESVRRVCLELQRHHLELLGKHHRKTETCSSSLSGVTAKQTLPKEP